MIRNDKEYRTARSSSPSSQQSCRSCQRAAIWQSETRWPWR